jgi:hypothetical protein
MAVNTSHKNIMRLKKQLILHMDAIAHIIAKRYADTTIRHIKGIIRHANVILRNIKSIIRHVNVIIRHMKNIIRHMDETIHHIKGIIRHKSDKSRHMAFMIHHTAMMVPYVKVEHTLKYNHN